ncbi:Cation efflux system protein CusC precursor [Methylibium sp. T29]|nr:Cation efflux system protein CusC precursor [Methylibium sp. T29]
MTDLSALPLGTTEAWLARRPDLIAAERQLAAATANIGVAKADLYPRISLSGLLGLNAATLGDLGRSESAIYSLGAGLSWSVLDFGRVRSRIAASEARAQASLASYEQTVATALEETEGALTQFTRNAQRAERLDRAARSAEEAAGLARLRYDAA